MKILSPVVLGFVGLAFVSCGVVGGHSSSLNSNGSSTHIFPGEFESHEAVWLSWPTYTPSEKYDNKTPILKIIKETKKYVTINLLVNDEESKTEVKEMAEELGISLDHVNFYEIEFGDVWARDVATNFLRDKKGTLKATDWNFNLWGHEEPTSEDSMVAEAVDRTMAEMLNMGIITAKPSPVTNIRMIHEGGGVTHNGKGTMIAVESVVIQRNMGPERFCGGAAPVADYSHPTTYKPTPGWIACKKKVEKEYRQLMGVKNFIWVPTGVVEDDGSFRGAILKDIHVKEFEGKPISHSGVYNLYTTNGHADEFVRFVDTHTVLLTEIEVPKLSKNPTDIEKMAHALEEENHRRIELSYNVLKNARAEDGKPLKIKRIPSPEPLFTVLVPGDEYFEYFSSYDRWEDDASFPSDYMLAVLPASYANFFPTNNLVLVAEYFKEGRNEIHRTKDLKAKAVLKEVFPDRDIVSVNVEAINVGGGGINCITQQQPASYKFAAKCDYRKAKHDLFETVLYKDSTKRETIGWVGRYNKTTKEPIHLRVLERRSDLVKVFVEGSSTLKGHTGWMKAADLEVAGERCVGVTGYSMK